MKKIMFNDKYGLTRAVIDGNKKQTRRIVTDRLFQECRSNGFLDAGGFNDEWKTKSMELLIKNSPYKRGEEVAVAMCYGNCGTWFFPVAEYGHMAGYTNKMFVRAEDMPYRIKITNIRVERLQDISDEDCLQEGIRTDGYKQQYYCASGFKYHYSTPREAFAVLIDKTCGKGTWESNPWVFVYDFELLK